MCLDLSVHVFAFLLFVHLPQDRVLQALCYIHVLTTGLGVAGFVLILCMYFPQDWVLQSLCYYCTCTYHRTGCCRLCVVIIHVLTTGRGVAGFVLLLYMYLPQDGVLQALCYCPCTYHRTGCCRLCVMSMYLLQDCVLQALCYVHVLTTGLGVVGFVLLLYMHLPQDWVLQALCYYCPCTYDRTGCCRFGWHCPCCLCWCHRHSCRPHWLELDCCRVGFVSACPIHTSHCRYSRCSSYPSSRSLAQL